MAHIGNLSAGTITMDTSTQSPDDAPASSSSSAERSLRLLSILADSGRPMSLADLVAELGLPKATVHRLCGQLLACGFVSRDVNERDFVVGPALRKLALDTLNHGSLRGLRHEVLSTLVAQVGETCNFTTMDGARVLYLDRVEAPWPWRLTLDVGAHVPLHCTASGKLFLAFMDEPRREAMFRTLNLQAITPHSITTTDALRQACAVIREQGYASDREEFVIGLVAIAVPVRDKLGEVRAALAVHGPTGRLPLEQALLRLPALREAAERMTPLL
jgi:DNA-binding IclR family transcriptional regulator